MARPRFSIITPVHVFNEYRQKAILRAIQSIANQTFDKSQIEHVILNDGSTLDFEVPNYPWIKLITQDHQERINATRNAMAQATGEIFCFLDSDDEYAPDYLEEVDAMFRDYPQHKMFNFGAKYIHDFTDHPDRLRDSFKPKHKKSGGHVKFGGNNIVNGTFVLHRSVYDDLGSFPQDTIEVSRWIRGINYRSQGTLVMSSPFDFSAAAQMEFPEIRTFFMVDTDQEKYKIIKELGNPWGNDYYLFYKYTRKYNSMPFDKHLYIVHQKEGVV